MRRSAALIIRGDDRVVLGLNRRAAEQLRCYRQLAIVPGATHLFEEPGALQAGASLAGEWCERYLGDHDFRAGGMLRKVLVRRADAMP